MAIIGINKKYQTPMPHARNANTLYLTARLASARL